jgi:hypothetical protein
MLREPSGSGSLKRESPINCCQGQENSRALVLVFLVRTPSTISR